MSRNFARPAFALGLFLPSLAHAHAGIGAARDLISGLAHPISGSDHFLAMLAVGIWAFQMGRRFIWRVPLAFAGVMSLGGVLGILGMSFPFSEAGIVVSVLVMGILIATAARLPLAACATVAGLFGVFHGLAHGAEMPPDASGAAYIIGFALSTITLHLCGTGFGLLMRRASGALPSRLAGVLIASFGGYSFFAG